MFVVPWEFGVQPLKIAENPFWWKKRDQWFITLDSCPRNKASKPRRISWKPWVTSQEVKTKEKAIEVSCYEKKNVDSLQELLGEPSLLLVLLYNNFSDKIYNGSVTLNVLSQLFNCYRSHCSEWLVDNLCRSPGEHVSGLCSFSGVTHSSMFCYSWPSIGASA